MTNKIDQRVDEYDNYLNQETGIHGFERKEVQDRFKQALTQTHKEALQEALELVRKKKALTVFDSMDTRCGETRGEVRKYKLALDDMEEALQAKIDRV